jgi:hypothetical protein
MSNETGNWEKDCPNCEHPMMKGPLVLGRHRKNDEAVIAAWWCANCHFFIEAEPEEGK